MCEIVYASSRMLVFESIIIDVIWGIIYIFYENDQTDVDWNGDFMNLYETID